MPEIGGTADMNLRQQVLGEETARDPYLPWAKWYHCDAANRLRDYARSDILATIVDEGVT
jgi:hypothetical protein